MTHAATVSASYDGSNALFRMLRDSSWGPELMNLGWFKYKWPFDWLNLTFNLAETQRQLAYRSIGLLAVGQHNNVLDVACGRGMTTYMICRMHPTSTATGIDLMPENVTVAESLFANVDGLRYQLGDATDLTFDDESFDRIHCLEAAFHFPQRERFVAEAARVLKPSGRLAIVDIIWGKEEYRQNRDTVAGGVVRRIWQWEDLYSLDEYKQAADAAGLTMSGYSDWTDRVSDRNTVLLSNLAWLGRRPWGRRLIDRMNPLLRGMNEADWSEINEAAEAHRELQPYTTYAAMVFEKP